jgi:hypothetical protein
LPRGLAGTVTAINGLPAGSNTVGPWSCEPGGEPDGEPDPGLVVGGGAPEPPPGGGVVVVVVVVVPLELTVIAPVISGCTVQRKV